MMTCPTCGEPYVYGTLFCLECGVYLLEAQA
ncbi:MAG: FHA domain-containing protein, partial [Chloroflexota bacterium]